MALQQEYSEQHMPALNKYDAMVAIGSGLLALYLSGEGVNTGLGAISVGVAAGATGILVYEILNAEFPNVKTNKRKTAHYYANINNQVEVMDPDQMVLGQTFTTNKVAPEFTRVSISKGETETTDWQLRELQLRRGISESTLNK